MDPLSALLKFVFDPKRETPSPSLFNTHKHLVDFYYAKVCFQQDHQAKLRENRRACLNRLEDGLRRLGEKRRREYRVYERVYNQGSYAMHTLIQHPKNEYDIDVAVIFEEKNLPTTPLKARQLVADALRAPVHNFATKPLARTNAVTIWYGEGQHVDLAVYRKVTVPSGSTYLEHAGSEWRRRDPREITRWFFDHDRKESPRQAPGVAVPKGQFRRVVQLIKAFARSRLSWQLPGGLVLSTLTSKVYRPHPERDDVALYETLVALQAHLRENKDFIVHYPVPPGHLLTNTQERKAQVRRLLEKLDFVLPHLKVLKNPACLEFQALAAWNWVFHHNYWRKRAREAELAARVEPEVLPVRASLADRKEGPIRVNCRGSMILAPKGDWLCFSLRRRLELEPPFKVNWILRGGGQESTFTEERWPEHSLDKMEFWVEAVSPGRHSLTCELIKDGKLFARGARHFRVVSS